MRKFKYYIKGGESQKSYTHLHKSREIKYQFILDNSSIFRVDKMCNVLGIKRSSYYAWLKRMPSERKINDKKLVEEIKKVHKESYGTYGARRIKAKLNSDGIKCGKNKVYKLMKENNIFSKVTRKLVIDAFNSAILKESPEEGFIFHSDGGVQYASYDYQNLLRENGCIQSMSAKGCCYDNASAESFFSSLKKEFFYGRKFKTRAEARQSVVEYIELFYNSKRLHSTLDINLLKNIEKVIMII